MSVKNLKTTTTLKAFLWLGIYVCLVVSIGCMAPKLMPLSDEDKERYKIPAKINLLTVKTALTADCRSSRTHIHINQIGKV